jgi:hypothetical protein
MAFLLFAMATEKLAVTIAKPKSCQKASFDHQVPAEVIR